jgi:uncharacterized repeat protein (TIGR01451 family)
VPVLLLLAASAVFAQNSPALGAGQAKRSPALAATETQAKLRLLAMPLHFEPNQGQSNGQVKFTARGAGYTMFLTPMEAVLALRQKQAGAMRGDEKPAATQWLHFSLQKANPHAEITAEDQLPGRANYLIGNDRNKWHTDVPLYGRVRYREIYPGIDLVYYGNQQRIEHDFRLAPGADPHRIVLQVKGARRLRLEDSGDLLVETSLGAVRMRKPDVYQEVAGKRVEVAGAYQVGRGKRVWFKIGEYDRSRELVIDPLLVLEYSSFYGGLGTDEGNAIALDPNNNVYIAGDTTSLLAQFPAASSSALLGGGGATDAFVVKLAPSGPGPSNFSVNYLTIVGGTAFDQAHGIAADRLGNAYVAGETLSLDFPVSTSPAAFQAANGQSGCPLSCSPADDAFFFVLNSTGSALLYSTYLGGSQVDHAQAIAIDPPPAAQTTLMNTYITGHSNSGNIFSVGPPNNFPTIPSMGSFSPGIEHAYVSKLNPNLSGSASLLYSRFLGNSITSNTPTVIVEVGRGITVDGPTPNPLCTTAPCAYIAGETNDPAYPTTASAFQATGNGGSDAFLTVVDSASPPTTVYSSLIGGSGDDFAYGIAIDNQNPPGVYITGQATANTLIFPTTSGAFQSVVSGTTDAFVSKFNVNGSGSASLVYSTLYGANGTEAGYGITVDQSTPADAYIVGATTSTAATGPGALPGPTIDSVLSTVTGLPSAFLAEINGTGTNVLYRTLLGGSTSDQAFAVALDAKRNAYFTGQTLSADFPLTSATALQTTLGGTQDAFVSVLNLSTDVAVFVSPSAPSVNVGAGTSYIIQIVNEGALTAQNASLSITGTGASETFQLVGLPTGGSCAPTLPAAPPITCTVTSVAPGASASFVFTVTINAGGNAITTATVSLPSPQFDPNPANDTASGTVFGVTGCSAFSPPVGTTNSWTGATDVHWNIATNWSAGTVPISTDNVFVCAQAPNQPVLSAGGVTNNLTNTGVINTNGFTLTAGGTVDSSATGSAIIDSTSTTGTLAMPGAASIPTLKGIVPNLSVGFGACPTGFGVAFAGPTTIVGNLNIVGCQLDVNGQTATMSGNLNVTSGGGGLLIMQNPAGLLAVAGNASFGGGNETGNLTAGTLQVAGNFSTISGCCLTSFAASGTHLTVLNGSTLQTVSMANPGPGNDHFQNLEVANTGGVSLLTNIAVGGNFSVTTAVAVSGNAKLSVGGNITTVAGSTVNPAAVDLKGSLNASGTWAPVTMTYSGTNQQIQGNMQNLQVPGTASLSGNTTVTGDLTISGTLTVNGFTLNVGGNLKTINYTGQLVMNNPADQVNVTGYVDLGGASDHDFWTAGTLTVGGNLQGSNCCNPFLWASGAHTLVMNGSAAQTMAISPNALNGVIGHLGNLTIANANGVTLSGTTPPIEVLGNLVVSSGSLNGGQAVGMGAAAQFRVDGNVNVLFGANLTLGSISIGGALASAGTFSPTKVIFNGANPQVITPGLAYQSIEVAQNTTAQFGGTTTISGDLNLFGAASVNGQTVYIDGNLRTLNYHGELDMNNPADLVNVTGFVDLGGASDHDFWTAGTLTVGGNLQGSNCCNPFLWASGAHTLVMNGSAAQTMAISPNALNGVIGHLGNLTIANANGVTLSGTTPPIEVLGNLVVSSGSLNGGQAVGMGAAAQFRVDGNVNVLFGANLTLGSISIGGALASAGTFSPTKVIFNGANPQVITPGLAYQSIEVAQNTSAQFTGATSLTSDLNIYGIVSVNGQTVNIGGNLRTLNYLGELDMNNPADQVNVVGFADLGGASDHDFWTAGTLQLAGNLQGSNCCNPFLWASGVHTLVMNGSAAQTMAVSPNALNGVVGHLGNVTIANTSGVTIPSASAPIQILGNLNISPGSIFDIERALPVASLTTSGTPLPTLTSSNASALTATSVNVNGLTVNGVPFIIGGGAVNAFNFVVFQNMPATLAQLTVQNTGASVPLVFSNLQFLTTPVNPGLYISATDTVADAFPLIINLQQSFPPDGSAQTATFGGAVVNWPGNFADLALHVTGPGSQANVSDNLTYNYTITNNGPGTATTVALHDPLSPLVTLVSATASQGSCSQVGGSLICSIGTMAASATVNVSVVLNVVAPGVLNNTATVTATQQDPNPGNDSLTVTTNILTPADLALSAGSSSTTLNGSPAYSVMVTNNGPGMATNVVLTDTLERLGFVTATSTQGTCSFSSGVVTCAIGTLANGASVSVTVAITPPGTGWASHEFHAKADEADPNPLNNSMRISPPVGPGGSVATASAQNVLFPSVLVGNSVQQAVTLTNTGSGTLAISGMNATGPFSATSNCGGGVTAASSCTINVAFTPQGVGGVSGTLTIVNNGTSGSLNLILSGTGADISLTVARPQRPTRGGTNALKPGQAAQIPLVVSAPAGVTGTVSLACQGAPAGTSCAVEPAQVTLNGSGTATALVVVQAAAASGLPPSSHVPGLQANLQIIASTGNGDLHTAILPILIADSAGTEAPADSPGADNHHVRRAGDDTGATTATTNVPAGVVAAAPPALSVSAKTLVFEASLRDKARPVHEVTIRNQQSLPLAISDISVSGSFESEHKCGSELAPDASCTITVKFTRQDAGESHGTVTITTGAGIFAVDLVGKVSAAREQR